jgi:UDP-sulfoquinovose synthase
MSKVLILGGDGYLGWPTAMHLSSRGHTIAVADSYLKRELVRRAGAKPLLEPPHLHERVRRWRNISRQDISVFIGDLCEWSCMESCFREFQPDAIVHYAEQPSAPFSMMDRESAQLTLHNNLGVTLNLVQAVREFAPDAHIIKLGTMGEYGTPNIDIEEGWLEIEHKGRKAKFLFPRQASSLYHTTKVLDTDLLWFYVRTWGLRVTDLMQGPVYGYKAFPTNDPGLLPAFHYDEVFGTVVNRFIVQAVKDVPLTVYGAGGQTRGYLNIIDTLQCIQLVVENPPPRGEMRILNQFVDVFSVNELAEKVVAAARSIGLNVQVQSYPNPRKELEEHYYNPMNTGLRELGLEPHFLNEGVLVDMLQFAAAHRNNIDESAIQKNIRWDTPAAVK